MMLFGEKSDFAIETMVEPGLVPPTTAWGRMCIWCQNVPLGDIENEHCGLGQPFNELVKLVHHLDSLWLNEFEGMSDLDLLNHLDELLYGYHGDIEIEDSRSLEQCKSDAARYGIFNFLTNWEEQFDGFKAFIFNPPGGRIRILSHGFPKDRAYRLSTSVDSFSSCINSAALWFQQQQTLLGGPHA